VRLIIDADQVGEQSDARLVAFHLGKHDVVSVQIGADTSQIPECPGLVQGRGVADDAQLADPFGRRQSYHGGIRDSSCDLIEVVQPRFVVERHHRDPDPPIDGACTPGTGHQQGGDNRQTHERSNRSPAATRNCHRGGTRVRSFGV